MADAFFEVKELELSGVLLIAPKFPMMSGVSVNVYNADIFYLRHMLRSWKISPRSEGVLRGLHFRTARICKTSSYAARRGRFSMLPPIATPPPTYGKYLSARLTGDEQTTLYIPGSMHGFCVVSDEAIVEYKLGDTYHPESRVAPVSTTSFAIEWPVSDLLFQNRMDPGHRL